MCDLIHAVGRNLATQCGNYRTVFLSYTHYLLQNSHIQPLRNPCMCLLILIDHVAEKMVSRNSKTREKGGLDDDE